MSTRFYDTDLTDAAWAFVAPVLPLASPGRGDRVPPTFVPSSTPSFTSCGQAASGDCCHANFLRVARSTITFKPGKTPGYGSIYIASFTSRPVVMPDGQLVHRW